MYKVHRISAIAMASALGVALPSTAWAADPDVARQIAEMRAQISAMSARIDTLQGELDQANARADAATETARQATVAADTAGEAARSASAAAAKAPPVEVAWKGAPEISAPGGWSFKPRGRIQVDAEGIDAPSRLSGGANDHTGFGTEVRRAYLGFDGTMPGGFGYRAEIDVANSSVQITDLYLSYKAGKSVTLTLGQQKPFWGIDELTSDLFTSMLERASFTQAFNFERRLGLGVQYLKGPVLLQGGAFTDDVQSLNSDADRSWSLDGRAIFMPKLAGGQLHIGGSVHYRSLGGDQTSDRFRARPFVHTTDVRFVDTGSFPVSSELDYGAEAAFISGRFHATAEQHWLTARRPGLPDPTFSGGFAEVGYLLTDDETAYKNGTYDRIKPKNPVGSGGIGAVQVNARYDWLDLSDAGVNGGQQKIAGLSAVWTPTAYLRFIADYGHIWIDDGKVTVDGNGSYQANAMGMRAQIDF